MSGCCCCCTEGQQESDIANTKGPDVGPTPCIHTSQVQVTFDTDNDAVTSQAMSKGLGGLRSQITMLLNPIKSAESIELGGMGFMRQSSRYELGFTKDYLSGSIKFVGSGNAHLKYTKSKYMVVDPDEDPDVIVNALAMKWNLHFPKLLICILGGDEVSQANPAMEKAFRKGLVEAVLSTDVWLFTGGLNCGMMKSVGHALTNYAIGRAMVKHRDVVAVGVAPLGILRQKDKLLGMERRPVMYNMDGDDSGGGTLPSYHLEPNHTHFILVGDDHEDSEPGTEVTMRNKLVNKIAECKIKDSNATVPVLYLVFGGDSSSIQTVYDAVMEKKIPILIIPDSGGAADVLSFAIKKAQTNKNTTGEDILSLDIKVTQEIRMKLDLAPNCHIKVKDQIKEIIKRKHLINIYKQEVRIEEAILQALMNANRGCNGQDDLHLAVIWNRIDLAKKELTRRKWKVSELKDSFYYALVNNQHKFVKLFIDEGNVDLKKFLSAEILADLYRQVGESSILYRLLGEQRVKRHHRGGKHFTLKDVSNVLKKLIFDTYEPIYDRDNFYDGEACFLEPLRELFLWAVLLHRFELAKLFWKWGKPTIGGALLGCKLLKALSELNTFDPQESAEMYEHAKEFQTMAIDLLNLCYTEDRCRTSLLLVRNLPDWGNSTCLDLAAASRSKQFIAHAAVQNLLNELWMGRLSRHTGLRKRIDHSDSEDATDSGLSQEDKTRPKNQSKKTRESCVYQSTANDESDDCLSVKTHTTLHRQHNNNCLSCWYKLKLFYEAPVISFRLNMIAHFVFLGLFSYILLSSFEEEISIMEMVLIGWVFTLFTEEMRQLLQEDYHTLYHRFDAWLWGYWNCIDLASLAMFAVGVGLRFHPVTLDAARIVLALDLIVFYLRILHIFSASKLLGPKLIMILRMMVELVSFMAILIVFMVAYGVACQAILFPNSKDPVSILKGVFYQSYFQLYGELFLEDMDQNECTMQGEDMVDGMMMCPQHAWFGIVVLALYLFISNILLLNLLIAMLNYTFQAVQENTDTFWKFQRYQLVKEYYQRPSVIPPLIIIIHVYQMIRWAWDKCFPKHKMYRSPNLMKRELRQEKHHEIVTWEDVKGEDYLAAKKKWAHQDSYKRMKQTDEKLEHLSSRMTKYFDGARLNKALEGRFNILEAQIASLEQLVKRQSGVDVADSVAERSKSGHLQVLRHHPEAYPLTKSKAATSS